ncbi:MAG: MmgE/PrpD family protein [Actinobacteria bacterium]|nr:MmgE/PrpD family protein [Actinomycetota bacterium]
MLTWDEVPPEVRERITYLVRDFAAVSVAGRVTETARLAVEHASAEHPGDAATALLDGRRLSATGAAWANGVLANALDFDDGHRLTKGHPGANVIPAALAASEAAHADEGQLLVAIAVGYEVAIRAGIDLHARSGEYHASGAWGAVGAAVAAARLLGCDADATRHALGLAEYHAPIAPIMRSVADPAMTKDACGWGAFLGVSAALLARRGFTSAGSSFVERDRSTRADRWHLLDVYVKKFPCCRWAHPAIEAALELRNEARLAPEQIARVGVRTFGAAAAIARGIPATTEEAQYSLVWPVAVALAHGGFEVEHVLPPAFDDPLARRLGELVTVEVDPALESEFPARRRSAVTIETNDGARFESGLMEAPGEPDDPRWPEIVDAKAETYADEGLFAPAGPLPASSL